MTIELQLRLAREDFLLDAEMSLPSHGVTALFGPSGCGKTTLLRAVAGLEPGAGGRLSVGGEVWQSADEVLPPHRRPLGYVFQEASLFPHLNVRRNLEYGLKRIPAGEARIGLSEAAELLGVTPLLARRPAGLSGGERQRVAIARALLTSPRLLLMDEPLSALDRQSKADILPFLEQLHEQLDIPLLYVSHAPDEVARLADHLVLMDSGRVTAHGPIGEMLTRADLPLAHGNDAEALIEAVVIGHDDDFHLTLLDFPGGRFSVPRNNLPVGRKVRVRALAKDVSLTLERQSGTSILNIFPARVTALAELNPAQLMVHLEAGGVPVLSRITRKSASVLALEAGKELFAQVKSVAVLT